MQRLQKVLARAGVASRREAERMIDAGRVRVNGNVVSEQGLQVDPERDAIKVDGKRIPATPAQWTYLLLNKPRGYVTTRADPEGRPTVLDLLDRVRARVFPVGRLDFNSEGLLLLTDDGELAHTLMHPRHSVEKTYAVKVRGRPAPEALTRLSRGVLLEGRRTRPAGIRVTKPGTNTWLEVTVVEGRKHQVRNMMLAIGHPVARLRRVRYAGLELGRLSIGACRPLSPAEIAQLRTHLRGVDPS